MTEKRKPLDSEAKIAKAIADIVAKNTGTPIGERFINAASITAAEGYNTDLPLLIGTLNTADVDFGEFVDTALVDGPKLELNCSLFFFEMNGHINLDGNPAKVRKLFGLSEATGNNPNMDSESLLVIAGNNIKSGNEAMVTHGGWKLNTGFPASDVISRNDAYKALLILKSNAKDALGIAQVAVNEMLPLAKAVADDITAQIKYHYRTLTEAQIRDKCRGYGVDYETAKPLTRITALVVGPDGKTPMPNVLVRIGEVLTKDGKLAKEGVKMLTDINGIAVLDTTVTDVTNLIAKIIGSLDNITPLKIISEVPQSITIVMMPGVSSL
jgi:hypothetical protein